MIGASESVASRVSIALAGENPAVPPTCRPEGRTELAASGKNGLASSETSQGPGALQPAFSYLKVVLYPRYVPLGQPDAAA